MLSVTQLPLEHGPEKARSDAQGLLSGCIESATSAQARENSAYAAKMALERLQPKNSGAIHETVHSFQDTLADPTAAGGSAAGEAALGDSSAVHNHPAAEITGSTTQEDLHPNAANSDHVQEISVRSPGEDPQRLHTEHTAISPQLETLAINASQNTDILASLGAVLDKIRRIADVTVGAIDALAKVAIQAFMLRVRD